MAVEIRLSTTLRQYVPDYVPEQGLVADVSGQTPASVAKSLGIPVNEIKFVMINGRLGQLDAILQDGDRLGYFPPVGGG